MFVIPRLRQDWESGSRELCKLKDRQLEQAVKYSRALEEQGKASNRERELLRQVGGSQGAEVKTDNQTLKLRKFCHFNKQNFQAGLTIRRQVHWYSYKDNF